MHAMRPQLHPRQKEPHVSRAQAATLGAQAAALAQRAWQALLALCLLLLAGLAAAVRAMRRGVEGLADRLTGAATDNGGSQ